MIAENNGEYIQYRFNRAKEAFEEAEILAKEKRWNAVINRLYYACFYSAIAALLNHNIEAKTHEGVRKQFSLQFIKTEKLNLEYGRLFSKLFDYRQKGDYGDLFDFDQELTEPLIDDVKKFLLSIEELTF